MCRKFIEYLGTDCFNFCRIPVELSVVSMSNTKCTKCPSKMYVQLHIAYIVYDERGGRAGSIFHLFLPISPPKNNENMVSSEPSNLRQK
jgi:hypothetical protein